MTVGADLGRAAFRATSATDVGRRRKGNEDRHGIFVRPAAAGQPECTLLVVADGMGGANAGEVASAIALETVSRIFLGGGGAGLPDLLRRSLEAANHEIHARANREPALAGMGTTCTAVAVEGADVVVAHVGDSRGYRVGKGGVRQITQDHSLVARLVEQGLLTPAQAKVDPRHNMVTRSLGVEAEVEVDIERIDGPLAPGETLLVCSDGLHGLVADEELARIAAGPSLGDACAALIRLANERGGPDNITVILGRLEAGDGSAGPETTDAAGPAALPAPVRARLAARTKWLLFLSLLLLLGALAALAWLVSRLL